MSSPSLLVVLPTLGNRLDYLENTLRSCRNVAEAVPATIVMVVPRRAAAARKLGKQFGAIIIDDRGSGMADAVNAGLGARTTEDFYVWVGDDDELVAGGVVALAENLNHNPTAVVCYGQCDYIDSDGLVIGRSRAGHLARAIVGWGPNLIPHPGTVVRLDALESVGGFDPKLRYALDLDVFLKLRKMGEFISLPYVSARFRWHDASATVADRAASSREAIRVKRSHLPVVLRTFSWLWNYPVSWASHIAAWLVTHRSRRLKA